MRYFVAALSLLVPAAAPAFAQESARDIVDQVDSLIRLVDGAVDSDERRPTGRPA